MLYHLLVPFAEAFTPFNVFRYITFRSGGALLTALLISFFVGPRLIRHAARPAERRPADPHATARKATC